MRRSTTASIAGMMTAGLVLAGLWLAPTAAAAADTPSTVYIADTYNNRVVAVPADGGAQFPIGTGLSQPTGIVIDAAGSIYIADSGQNRVVKLPAGGGAQVTVATGLSHAMGLAVDAAGDLYIADSGHARVLVVPADGGSSYTVGSGLIGPTDVAVDAAGNVYIADAVRVVKVSADGSSQTTVGTALGFVQAVAVDIAGNVFVGDTGAHRVVEVLAGSGAQITIGTGLGMPYDVAVDAAGNVLILDQSNNRVVVVPAGGGAQTSLGTGLNSPLGMAVASFAVAFDANGGAGVSPTSEAMTYGAPVTAPTTLPTRSGYVLTGWNTEADGSGTAYTLGTTPVTAFASFTLYAQWTAAANDWPTLSSTVAGCTSSALTVSLAADVTAPGGAERLAVPSGCQLTIDLQGHVLTIPAPNSGLAGIRVPLGATLTVIDSTGGGAVSATGQDAGAGIGGDAAESCGTVVLDGGTIFAGSWSGAGIGGGGGVPGGIGCTVTIDGADVTAQSYTTGAGIGGGGGLFASNAGGSVTVRSGSVDAIAGVGQYAGGAAIGAGGLGTASNAGTLQIAGTRYGAAQASGPSQGAGSAPTDQAIAGTETYRMIVSGGIFEPRVSIRFGHVVGFLANGGTFADPSAATAFVADGHSVADASPDGPGGVPALSLADRHVTAWSVGSACPSATAWLASDVVTADVTVCPTWSENDYSVAFGTDPHATFALTDAPGTQYRAGDTVGVAATVDAGYHFTGWSATPGATFADATAASTSFAMPSLDSDGASVLVAGSSAANAFTVRYHAGSGGEGTAMADSAFVVDAGGALTAAGYTRPGYDFAGWATSDGGAAAYADEDPISVLGTPADGDVIDLYPVWAGHAYTVAFDANGGDGTMADQPAVVGTPQALTANAYTRAGSVFLGWATAADGAATYADGETVSDLDLADGATVTLYAVWRTPTVVIGTATARPGDTITVTGTGFTPSGQVEIVLHSDPVHLLTLTADGSGAFVATVTISAGTPAGAHTIEATDAAVTITATATLTVTALAATGIDPGPVLLLALLLLLLGAAALAGRYRPASSQHRRD